MTKLEVYNYIQNIISNEKTTVVALIVHMTNATLTVHTPQMFQDLIDFINSSRHGDEPALYSEALWVYIIACTTA